MQIPPQIAIRLADYITADFRLQAVVHETAGIENHQRWR